MNTKIILLLTGLLLQSALTNGQENIEQVIAEARSSILAMMEEEDIVGLSISLSLKDSLIWSEGFGHRDLQRTKPIEPAETRFRIASVSKPITTTILGRLVEEDLISFDESAYTYVPQFPKKKYDFSIYQLASHRSGIRHYKSREKENVKPMSLEAGLAIFSSSKLKFKPGTDYLYSSYGYNLLGVAMEKASGKNFETLLKAYVTEPLGMDHTSPDYGTYEQLQPSGFFTTDGKGKLEEVGYVYLAVKLPSGGILSTSEDLIKFGNAYAQKTLLQEQTQQELLTVKPLPDGKKNSYSMGWGVRKDNSGRTIISHSGGNVGSVCRLIVYPEEGLTLAVVSNTFGIDWLKFMRTVNKIPVEILETLNTSN